MKVNIGLFLTCLYLTTVHGCAKQGENPKVATGLAKEPTDFESPPFKLEEAVTTTSKPIEEVKICSEYCHYKYCVGGNPEEDGTQLSTNRTCENFCVWMNGTTPHDDPMTSAGECVKSQPTGDPYIDCQPCFKFRESKDFDSNEDIPDYQSLISQHERCCDILDVDSSTNTELDQMVSGQYYYYRDYKGYPSFRKEVDDMGVLVPLYLFYHDNRWVVEPMLGAVTTADGEELWGLLRWNGTYKCPENVGRQWTYWVYESGIVDKHDEPIDVSCATQT